MLEYEGIISEFSQKKYSMYSTEVLESDWGNIQKINQYLKKYWLVETEYANIWRPLQKRIFPVQGKGLPNFLFSKEFRIIPLRGGNLFCEDDFKILKECMCAVGDKNFVIIENTFGRDIGRPAFRLKFPVSISWSQLMGGNSISSVLLEMPHNEYFVFGDSATWGKYSANDYEDPLDLIGFKDSQAKIFVPLLEVPEEEKAEIREWVPLSYKPFIYEVKERKERREFK